MREGKDLTIVATGLMVSSALEAAEKLAQDGIDFEKQPIRRGETRTFRFEIDPEKDLSFTDGNGNRFLEPGDYFILVKDKKVKLTLTD